MATLALSLHGAMAADGPVAAVQSALKRHQLYAGEVTGVVDETTRAALRRFQVRHALPETGEIDTATLEMLQQGTSSTRPTVEALPPPQAGTSDPLATKDRRFLQKLETGLETAAATPAPAAVPAPAAPASAAEPRSAEFVEGEAQVSKSQPVEKSRKVAPRKVERSAQAKRQNPPIARSVEPEASGPVRRSDPRASISAESDPDPVGSHGTIIYRTTTTTQEADGRTYVIERKVSGISATPVPVRRAEPVVPRPKRTGFFEKLFQDDD